VLGIFAAKQDYIRHMPGRIVGRATDHDGRRGFVLTLQTREQHIRREKATSNICTNQGLLALAATVYLATVGLEGLRGVAEASCVNAHAAYDAVTRIKGYAPLCPGGTFFHEFAVRTPKPAAEIVHRAAQRGVLPGVALDRFASPMEDGHALLIAATEKRTAADVDRLVDALKQA
jgi:glycine dehydrogenase subunit 1